MKLVSVAAILIGAFNSSLFVKVHFAEQLRFPLSVFILSFIYIHLILLLEYEHRRFETVEIDIRETASLTKKYFYLFAAGLVLTLLHKFHLEQCNEYIIGYVLLGEDVYYSLLYYSINLVLGNVYLYLFRKNYARANRERIPSQICTHMEEEMVCSICLFKVKQGQAVARIACMHLFHSGCLHRWLKKKTACPMCKTKIDIV